MAEIPAHTPLAKALRAARKAAGLTQADVAARVGVTKGAVSQWEAGLSVPNDENTRSLAALYGVPAGALRFGDSTGVDPVERQTPRVMGGLPFAVREWIQEFLLRLVRARVSEREFERARSLLESEELSAWYGEGSGTRPPTEAEMLESVQAAGDFILGELRRRGYRIEGR